MQRQQTKENEESDLPLMVVEEPQENQTEESGSIGNLATDLVIDRPIYSKYKNLTIYGKNIHFTPQSKLESTANVTLITDKSTGGEIQIECNVHVTGICKISANSLTTRGRIENTYIKKEEPEIAVISPANRQ